MMRLQKILSLAGIASRRKSEELISQGRVSVNGKTATIGMSADAEKDVIAVNGKKVQLQAKKYILLYKPKGYVSTLEDRFAQRKVTDLIKLKERLYPVGRLDADAEGLLIMTNDGDFANSVAHPRYEVPKTYTALLKSDMKPEDLAKLNQGIEIEGRAVKAFARFLGKNLVEITVHEGRKHIVKLLFRELGYFILRLRRVKIGRLTLKGLSPGTWRFLTEGELKQFQGSLRK
ncbi:MAG: pseudouridine synthase [Candidatus Woesearchaeota archaeon]